MAFYFFGELLFIGRISKYMQCKVSMGCACDLVMNNNLITETITLYVTGALNFAHFKFHALHRCAHCYYKVFECFHKYHMPLLLYMLII